MFNAFATMIFNKQRDAQRSRTPQAHDPHRRGVITTPRATRRDGATYEPIIRNFW